MRINVSQRRAVHSSTIMKRSVQPLQPFQYKLVNALPHHPAKRILQKQAGAESVFHSNLHRLACILPLFVTVKRRQFIFSLLTVLFLSIWNNSLSCGTLIFASLWWILTGPSTTIGHHWLYSHRTHKALRSVQLSPFSSDAAGFAGSSWRWSCIYCAHYNYFETKNNEFSTRRLLESLHWMNGWKLDYWQVGRVDISDRNVNSRLIYCSHNYHREIPLDYCSSTC